MDSLKYNSFEKKNTITKQEYENVIYIQNKKTFGVPPNKYVYPIFVKDAFSNKFTSYTTSVYGGGR